MTTQRLLMGNESAGANIDTVSTVTQWKCDGCGVLTRDLEGFTRVQGQVYQAGLSSQIYGDYCNTCIETKPLSNLVRWTT